MTLGGRPVSGGDDRPTGGACRAGMIDLWKRRAGMPDLRKRHAGMPDLRKRRAGMPDLQVVRVGQGCPTYEWAVPGRVAGVQLGFARAHGL